VIRLGFAVAVAVGATLAGQGCSLLQLDDFALQPCKEDRDCFELTHAADGGLAACYRCTAGVCEPHGSLVAQRIDSVGSVKWLSAMNGAAHSTLLALGSGDPTQGASGIAIVDGTQTAKAPIDYREGPSATQLQALSLDWFAETHLIGVSLDSSSCRDGLIRVGVASPSTPFALEANGVDTVFTTGVDLDPTSGCTGSNKPGARAPALAAVTAPGGRSEALAIWLATTVVGYSALSNRCASAEERFVPVRGQALTLHGSEPDAMFEPADGTRTQQLSAQALDASAPRLLASPTLGYLLAYVDPEGVRLDLFPAFDAAQLRRGPRSRQLLDDPAADQIAVSLGAADGDVRSVLVVWSSGCDVASQLRAAVFRWSATGLEPSVSPFSLGEGAAIVGAPVVASAAGGFTRIEPRGGWAVMWSEQHGASADLRASRIGERAPAAEASEIIFSGRARFPFLHVPKSAPFAFGFAAGSSSPSADDLELMGCE
jgi:hypothetical protein